MVNICPCISSLSLKVRHELGKNLDVGRNWEQIAGEFDYSADDVRYIAERREHPTEDVLYQLSHTKRTVCELVDALQKLRLHKCIKIIKESGYSCNNQHANALPGPPRAQANKPGSGERSFAVNKAQQHKGSLSATASDFQENPGTYVLTEAYYHKLIPERFSSKTQNSISFNDVKKATYDFDEENLIGGGPQGFVFSGVLLIPDRAETEVAVKKFPANFFRSGFLQSDFAAVLDGVISKHRLVSQCLVPVVGYSFSDRDERCIITNFQEKSLQQVLSESRLKFKDKMKIIHSLANCIIIMHEDNFVHGNLKTSNAFVADNLDVILSDCDILHRLVKLPGEGLQKSADYQAFGWLILEVCTGYGLQALKDKVLTGFPLELAQSLDLTQKSVWEKLRACATQCITSSNTCDLNMVRRIKFVLKEVVSDLPKEIATPNRPNHGLCQNDLNELAEKLNTYGLDETNIGDSEQGSGTTDDNTGVDQAVPSFPERMRESRRVPVESSIYDEDDDQETFRKMAENTDLKNLLPVQVRIAATNKVQNCLTLIDMKTVGPESIATPPKQTPRSCPSKIPTVGVAQPPDFEQLDSEIQASLDETELQPVKKEWPNFMFEAKPAPDHDCSEVRYDVNSGELVHELMTASHFYTEAVNADGFDANPNPQSIPQHVAWHGYPADIFSPSSVETVPMHFERYGQRTDIDSIHNE